MECSNHVALSWYTCWMVLRQNIKESIHDILRLQKKEYWFSSAPLSNFYNNKRRATLLFKYSVLGNIWNACIFLIILFFTFFLMRTKTFIFQFKKRKKKKKIALPCHFSKKFLMRTKTFIFRGLKIIKYSLWFYKLFRMTFFLRNQVFLASLFFNISKYWYVYVVLSFPR